MPTLVIKIGTNVLSTPEGQLDEAAVARLVAQVAQLKAQGQQVLLISSGAVGAGRGAVPLPDEHSAVLRRQVQAAVGQVRLMGVYSRLFAEHGLHCAQVLATKEDFRDRQHYLNMKACFLGLLRHGIVPIANENDVVAVSELMFTDNDELAGLVASMVNADALLLLSNVEGLLDGPPDAPHSRIIREWPAGQQLPSGAISEKRSSFGRGGMMTKFRFAQKAAQVGIHTWIANGKSPDILLRWAAGEAVGTHFLPEQRLSNLKKWMAYSEERPKGRCIINAGAEAALRAQVSSLLPVGILRLEGDFDKGDLVDIINEAGQWIGIGKCQYGLQSALQVLGQKGKKAFIHYDYLFLKS